MTHYVSRSAIEDDQTCPRKRYWRTVFGGIGLESNDTGEELILGTALHAGLEGIWKSGDIEATILAVQAIPEWPKLSPMWQFWAEGILRGYYRVRYLVQRKTWEPLAVEEEVSYFLGTSPGGRRLELLAKPDVVLKHKKLGTVRYKEAKTTRVMNDKFIESWRKAVQLAAGQLGFAERGITIDQVQMIFFCKGEKADGYWRTPFLSAWRTVDQIVHSYDGTTWTDFDYKANRPQKWKGWERFNVWESGMTPAEWVAKLSDDDISTELPETPELVFDPQLRENWAEQTMYREAAIADAAAMLQTEAELFVDMTALGRDVRADYERRREIILNKFFPQFFKQCRPAAGYTCPFEALCWNPTIAAAPLATGLYRPRTPHHETEAKALRGE